MTPKQAAVALVAAIPTGVSVQQLEEYGIEATTEQAQAITQEVLSLNLFWIFAAIEAHLPQKYQPALLKLILDAMEAGWSTTVPVGSLAWTAYLNEWQERRRRYGRLVEEGVSPLVVTAEAAALMEENHLIKEEERRNLLTLLIDFVPVDTYGQLLEDVGYSFACRDLSEVAVTNDLPRFVQLIEQRRTSWDIQLQHLFSGELLQLHDQGS
jgi:hypothetical protein